MKYLKLFLVSMIALIALISVTLGWFMWFARGTGPGTATDVALLAFSPWYWLSVAVILGLATWALRSWVFVI